MLRTPPYWMSMLCLTSTRNSICAIWVTPNFIIKVRVCPGCELACIGLKAKIFRNCVQKCTLTNHLTLHITKQQIFYLCDHDTFFFVIKLINPNQHATDRWTAELNHRLKYLPVHLYDYCTPFHVKLIIIVM